MKTYFYRYKTGLYTAVQSFGLAWQHKALLSYALCASGISFLTSIVLFNLLNISFPNQIGLIHLVKEVLCAINPACSPEWGHGITLAITSFIVLSLSNFFIVAMLHRTAQIIAGQDHSFKESLAKVLKKIPLILSWSLVALIAEQVAVAASTSTSTLILIIALIFFVLFHFAAFFVLPLITYTSENLWGIMRLSATITHDHYAEILGGGTWFAVIVGLFFVPMALFWGYWHTSDLVLPWFKNGLVLIAALLVNLGIRIFLTTSFAIFKGLIYSDYRRKNPTLEDIYRFPWPQM